MDMNKYMTIKDAAAALGVVPHSLCNYVSRGQLSRTKKIDGVFVYLKSEVDKALADQQNKRGVSVKQQRKAAKKSRVITMALNAPIGETAPITTATGDGMVAIAFVPVSQLKATLAQLVMQ